MGAIQGTITANVILNLEGFRWEPFREPLQQMLFSN